VSETPHANLHGVRLLCVEVSRGVQIGIGVLAVGAGLGVGLLAGGGTDEDLTSSTLETLGSLEAAEGNVDSFQTKVNVPGLVTNEPEPEVGSAPTTPTSASTTPTYTAPPASSGSSGGSTSSPEPDVTTVPD